MCSKRATHTRTAMHLSCSATASGSQYVSPFHSFRLARRISPDRTRTCLWTSINWGKNWSIVNEPVNASLLRLRVRYAYTRATTACKLLHSLKRYVYRWCSRRYTVYATRLIANVAEYPAIQLGILAPISRSSVSKEITIFFLKLRVFRSDRWYSPALFLRSPC